jgi:DNA-directed RNA polymerase subunit RPC12/RpoP
MTESESTDEYVCGACGKSFPTEEALERHVHEVGLVD